MAKKKPSADKPQPAAILDLGALNAEQRGELERAIERDMLEKLKSGELSVEQLQAIADSGRPITARNEFSVRGFGDFYWCLFGRELPPHARLAWVPALVKAYREHTGVLLEGHRGSTKSTTLLAWALYVTGHRPFGNTVLVRINDDAAAEMGDAMAAIIEHHPGWRACFPYIVPQDTAKGWSTKGYFLKDTRVEYGEWVKMCVADHLGEPSVLVAGVTSGDIIGKHPSNGMYFDDLHNTRNTRSVLQMAEIVEIFESDIIPTWTRPEGHPTLGVACTLWGEKDVYHAMLRTGLFEHIRTPIFELDEESQIIFNGQRIRPNWPEAYPVERIEEIWKQNPVQFPRMYLCDLSGMRGRVLKRDWLHEYPSEKVQRDWPVYFGIDFASTEDKLKDKDRDYFALAVGSAIPGGGLVVTGGYRGKISTGEARQKVIELAGNYPSLQMIGVEKWGKGEEFKTLLLNSTNLPIQPMPYQGTPVRSKGERFEGQGGLASLFTMSRAWISDVKDDFLLAFEDEWVGWDGGRSVTGHDDTLDAVYWLCMIAAPQLVGMSAASLVDFV